MVKTAIIGGREIKITMCPPGVSALPWHLVETDSAPINERLLDQEHRSGVCPDDCEAMAPFIDGDPAVECDQFFSRPLKFHVEKPKPIDDSHMVGFSLSMAASIRRHRMARENNDRLLAHLISNGC